MSAIEDRVCLDIQQRAYAGLSKYGVTVERTDIDLRGWLQHLYEEQLDAAVYTKRAIIELDKVRDDLK